MIDVQTPPGAGSAAGPERKRNCSALDKPQFIGPNAARQAQNRLRRERLVERLHRLGPAPLYHLLNEVERGWPVWPHVERYAALPADFIKANGGDKFAPSLHCIDGGKP